MKFINITLSFLLLLMLASTARAQDTLSVSQSFENFNRSLDSLKQGIRDMDFSRKKKQAENDLQSLTDAMPSIRAHIAKITLSEQYDSLGLVLDSAKQKMIFFKQKVNSDEGYLDSLHNATMKVLETRQARTVKKNLIELFAHKREEDISPSLLREKVLSFKRNTIPKEYPFEWKLFTEFFSEYLEE